MTRLEDKISFALRFNKPVDAVKEFLDQIIRLKSMCIIEDTDPDKERVRTFDPQAYNDVAMRGIARTYDMVIDHRHGVGVSVTVDGEQAVFVPEYLAAKRPDMRVSGTVHFPGGMRFVKVQIGFHANEQRCVGVKID